MGIENIRREGRRTCNAKKSTVGILFIFLATIMLVIAGYRLYIDNREVHIQKGIASNIIRFHVRAESDSDEDQWIKMQVKEAVLDYISPILSKSQSVDESRAILTDELLFSDEDLRGYDISTGRIRGIQGRYRRCQRQELVVCAVSTIVFRGCSVWRGSRGV